MKASHILKFIGVLALMYFVSMIPFGYLANLALVIYSLWGLTK